MEDVNIGKRPTYEQLRNLNRMKAGGFADVIMKEDVETRDYALQKIEEINTAKNEINAITGEIKKTKDLYAGMF
jgi:hypothetical protein